MWESIIKRGPEATLELVEAFTRLFNGTGTKKDAEIVFVELMSFSGFFNVAVPGSDLQRFEGARSVGGRLFSLVNMPDIERDWLYKAARQQAIINQEQGEL